MQTPYCHCGCLILLLLLLMLLSHQNCYSSLETSTTNLKLNTMCRQKGFNSQSSKAEFSIIWPKLKIQAFYHFSLTPLSVRDIDPCCSKHFDSKCISLALTWGDIVCPALAAAIQCLLQWQISTQVYLFADKSNLCKYLKKQCKTNHS